MNKKIRWITETAVMLALLMALQTLTKPLGQLVTGSCVNAILAVTALIVGLSGSITVALLSPVLAYLLGIAPNVAVVPAIMLGNTVFVTLMALIAVKNRKNALRQVLAWLAAAVAKFAVLYAVVVLLMCGLFSDQLLAAGILKAPMLQALPATFSWLQLFTALIGGAAALMIVPLLRKALDKQ